MTWARLDDSMPEHEKIAPLSDKAFRAYVEAICYSARNLTDGRIPTAMARRCGWERSAPALVSAGLWEAADGGWLIHDYLDFNPSKEQVEDERERNIEARRSGGRARAATAVREGGRFTSSPPAGVPAEAPASADQQSPAPSRSRPDPVPSPEVPSPTAKETPKARAKPEPKRVTVVDAEFEARMVAKYADCASEERIRDEIRKALGHKAALKYHDLQAYVGGWLRDTDWSTGKKRYAGRGVPQTTYAGVHGQERGADVWESLVHRE